MSNQVIHDMDAFEKAGAVGGHMPFLKPKEGITIIAVKRRCRHELETSSKSLIFKSASSNEKNFYETLDRKCPALEPFLLLG